MKQCGILSKAFSVSIEVIKTFLSFLLLMRCITFYRFAYVEPPLHPWDDVDLVMVDDLSHVLLNSLCHYFIEYFCIDVH
jgi:hypothetical protein